MYIICNSPPRSPLSRLVIFMYFSTATNLDEGVSIGEVRLDGRKEYYDHVQNTTLLTSHVHSPWFVHLPREPRWRPAAEERPMHLFCVHNRHIEAASCVEGGHWQFERLRPRSRFLVGKSSEVL